MNCATVESCLATISEYFGAQQLGQPFIVNVENYGDYKQLRERMESDANKQCFYVSDYTFGEGELPNIEAALRDAAQPGNHVLLGLSQALMLQSEKIVAEQLAKVVNRNVHSYLLVIVCQCRNQLQPLVRRDPRLARRIAFVEGKSVPIPSLRITYDSSTSHGKEVLHGVNQFLQRFERTGATRPSSFMEYAVVTMLSQDFFSDSLMPVRLCKSSYDTLCGMYGEMAASTRESYGTEEQWDTLLEACSSSDDIHEALGKAVKSKSTLEETVVEYIDSDDEYSLWALWLTLKLNGCQKNEYLDLVIKRTEHVLELAETIYDEILNLSPDDQLFKLAYEQRRELLSQMHRNLSLLQDYCGLAGAKGRQEAYYLTDLTEMERYRFICCLANYEYNREELESITSLYSLDLNDYVAEYSFDESNTSVPSGQERLRGELTSYFEAYKLQKLTNRLNPEFLNKVTSIALDRPYNMLQPRSSIIAHMNRDDADAYFFDALGVEYLSFITRAFRRRGLLCEVSVGRCELPSITSCNKDFEQYFPGIKKNEGLDELKHHSAIYDYRKRHEPIHIFDELAIITKLIKDIEMELTSQQAKKVVIISDHGASRLAVLYDHEEQATKLELEEKGEHSGRCCKSAEDPRLDGVAYENGYAVLANYDRFKGSRRANLEVHGGATLEEVVVPVMQITLPPERQRLSFAESVIVLRQKDKVTLRLYAAVALGDPKIRVEGKFYQGSIEQDARWSTFVLPDIRRSGEYEAEIYDGNTPMNFTLTFTVQRATGREKKLF